LVDCVYCRLCVLQTVCTADCVYCRLCVLQTVCTADCVYCRLRVLQTRIVASVYLHITERSCCKRYVFSWILVPNHKAIWAEPECKLNSTRKHSHVHLTYTRTQPRNNYNRFHLTLILLTWRIWWAPNNASKWQMGFNSAFKGLKYENPDLFTLIITPTNALT